MAKKKNVEMYDRALRLYRLNELTTEEKRKEFDALTETQRNGKVDRWKRENKHIIVYDMLVDFEKLNEIELTKLKEYLQTYLNEVNDAINNIPLKEIESLEKEKELLVISHNKQIKKIDKKIEQKRKKIKSK